MRNKKFIALLLAAGMVTASLTACGGGDSKTTTAAATTAAKTTTAAATTAAATTAAATTAAADTAAVDDTEAVDATEGEGTGDNAELQAALDEMASALDGTCWIGMDAEYSCYAMAFNGTQIGFAANDGSEVDGYWTVAVDTSTGAQTLDIYEDEAMTSLVSEVPWSWDSDNQVLTLNETAVMAQVDADSFSSAGEAIQQYATAQQVASYLGEGSAWAGTDDQQTEVDAVAFNGNQYYLASVSVETAESAELQGVWSMDYDNIYFYNEDGTQLVMQYGWQSTTTEDGTAAIMLTDENGGQVAIVQTDAADVKTAMQSVYDQITGAAE